jgi:hypothetical protein
MSQSRSWKTNEQHNDTISFTRSNESIRQENTIHIFSSQMSDSLDNALRQFYRSRKITVKNLKPKTFEVIYILEKANRIFWSELRNAENIVEPFTSTMQH